MTPSSLKREQAKAKLLPAWGTEHNDNRFLQFLGQWRGHSISKRSGLYGATVDEHETIVTLEMDEKGQLLQDITITIKVLCTGTKLQNMVTFDKGFQWTLLPGGMYIGCPSDIAKSVAESKTFHLEFCWLDSSDKRQRLVRTHDANAMLSHPRISLRQRSDFPWMH